MDREFFDNATLQDAPASLIFFADLIISQHEPEQTYEIVDDVTGDLVTKTISPGAGIISVCGDNARVRAPRIYNNGGPLGTDTRMYEPYPMSIVLPESGSGRIDVVQLTIDNIDRLFVDVLRRLRYPLKVSIAVGFVMPADQDPVIGICSRLEHRFIGLDLIDVTITPELITGQLIIDNILWKKYPNNHETYSPSNFPGLWSPGNSETGLPTPPSEIPESDATYIDTSRSSNMDIAMPPGSTHVFRLRIAKRPPKPQMYVMLSVVSLYGSGLYTSTLKDPYYQTPARHEQTMVVLHTGGHDDGILVPFDTDLFISLFNSGSNATARVSWTAAAYWA